MYVQENNLLQPIWLTGTFYHVNPFSHSKGNKEVPPNPEDRPSWVTKIWPSLELLSLPGTEQVSPTSHESPTLYLCTHLLTLWDAPRWNHTKYVCLNHGSATERRNSTLEMSFNVDSPCNRNFSSILKKHGVLTTVTY